MVHCIVSPLCPPLKPLPRRSPNTPAGILKFWLTSGRGGFGLSTRECTEPGFYVMATSETVHKMRSVDRTVGYRACVACVPPALPPFSAIKSSNYLRNAMAQLDAETNGYDVVSEAGAGGRK